MPTRKTARRTVPPLPPILAEFRPINELWQGADAPSEQSVRWELRQRRVELTDAGALAYRHGRLYFHPQRYQAVIERAAIDLARRKVVSE